MKNLFHFLKGVVAIGFIMGSFNAENGFGGTQLSSRELGLKEEPGTCNVCVSSFSPCVSIQMASTATKTNEFLGKACQKKDSNHYSFNDADLSSPRMNRACNDRQRTSSESSHPLSVCLSRESFSDVVESEETLRDCNTYESIKMNTKTNLPSACANNIGPLKAPIFHNKFAPNKFEKQESECLGDNISFVCVSDYAKTRAADHTSDEDKKNASYNSASVESFPGTEKEVNGQPACFLVGSPCDLSEISSLRDSCAGASSAKREQSECSEEQVQSSFARTGAVQVGSQIGDGHNYAESMEVDNRTNEREQTAELKSTTVAKEINMEETNIGSQPAACSDAPDSIEYEVKVCDICGDIGREELLAVCSNCSDGAEHIYCMRVKMDSVPKGDWMCEECVLSKETERRKQDKMEGGVKILKKTHASESETKPLEVEESEAHKVSSIPLFTSKRPPGSLQAVRNKAFGTDLKSPTTSSCSSKVSMHQSGGHSSSTTPRTVCSPTELRSKSLKLPSQYQVSKGLLSKSKSFSNRSLKEDVQLLKEGSCGNEGLAKGTAASESERRIQTVSKSMSLKNMSYTVNNSNHDTKLLPNSSLVEDLKRSRHPKGQSPIKTEKKLKLSNSDAVAWADKRIASVKNGLACPSSSLCNDLVDVKGHETSDNSLKTSSTSAQKSFLTEEKKRVLNVRHCVEYSTVVPAISKKHLSAAVQSERPCLRESTIFASGVHVPSWISVVPQLDSIWQGKFEIQRSGGLPFTCDGLQAHLSTYASHKVLEVVQKLPLKLSLEEAPRLSMWPTQFMKSHATEDNIALYFFAKELDSYERSYKNLLDRMIKYDFSLKGNFGGFELLIFPSNLLPEKSQRWNNMLFFWGVFRGKRVQCSEQISAMSASEKLFPPGKSSESLSALNSNALPDSMTVASGKNAEVCETKESSLEQKTNAPDVQISSQQVGIIDSSQREEKESRKRPEIDLNCSLQEKQEYFADHVEADDTNDGKRLKSCFGGMDVDRNRIKDIINDRCSLPVNGRGPSIYGNEVYDMSIVPPELDSVGNKYSWKHLLQQQVLSNDSGKQVKSSVSNLELALGVERRFSAHRNMPPSFMVMSNGDSRDEISDTNPSLALSLALPYPKAGGSGSGSGSGTTLKLASDMKLPKCQEVNTTLSLFGGSSES
ncbi:Zinc finger, PHD-type [Gossypium australe]|uniref:Zinc finger, PHD-type n=1 Tax=Gossypium australe TaxID=47621 RepID=A0A5B6V2F6_9ROSI|nr:Zinc finger, PHD-type [Gossypium australe]